MRTYKRPNNYTIIPLAAILLSLILGIMTIESQLFDRGESRYINLDDTTHIISVHKFYLQTPNDYQYFKLEGIDSYVGLITNGLDSIEFDYGLYSNDLTSEDYLTNKEQINGKEAVLGYSTTYGPAVHFPNLVDNNSLTIYSTLPKEVAFDIFRTVRFTLE